LRRLLDFCKICARLYQGDQIKEDELGGDSGVYGGGGERNAYRVLVVKLGEKTLLGRPRHRWEGNIKVDHIEIAWEVFD